MTGQALLGLLADGRGDLARGGNRPAPACGEDKNAGDNSFHIGVRIRLHVTDATKDCRNRQRASSQFAG
jgi:hypothetical protein